jgi:S-adenosyl methyltransferase
MKIGTAITSHEQRLYGTCTACREAPPMRTAPPRLSSRQYNESGAVPYHLRGPEQIARFFDGLDLVEPGMVPFTRCRPDDPSGPPAYVDGYCGVGRKP